MKQTIKVSGLLFSIGLLLLPQITFAVDELRDAVSKSTFIHRVDSPDEKIDRRFFSYMPTGTRIVLFRKTTFYRGSKRRLILTENGIWGYVKESNYWDKKGLKYFKKKSLNTFISRNHDVLVDVSKDLAFRIRFSRGEVHKFESEDEDNYSIEVSDQKKIGDIPRSIIPIVSIPRKNAKFIDYSQHLKSDQANAYKISIIDGVAGIKKTCNTEVLSATRKRVKVDSKVSFDISKFLAGLSFSAAIDASKESRKIESFPKDKNVTRTYYTRSGETGIYKITKIKGCGSLSPFEQYIYTNPDNQEITIDKEWAKQQKLKINNSTGQILITCAEQYFSFFDKLFDFGIQESEIPFLISHVAKFKTLDSKCD